jgi:hypothetical protein
VERRNYSGLDTTYPRRIEPLWLVLLLGLATALPSCVTDYAIVGGNGETEYVIVEVESAIPVHIIEEVEVPGEPAGDIWLDTFNQPRSVDGVDILWVIDTSGSMYQYQDELLLGIEAMLNALPPSGWRLAMISNNPPSAAAEAQFPLVPGDDIDDATDMLNAMLTGGMEEGFDSVYEYIVNNAYASTWMRDDAALLVVFVSDEEEQSNQYMINVNDFTSWYGSLRGGSSSYVSSIVNVEIADSICPSAPPAHYVGSRYMEATNFFGGIIVDICDEDWSPGVTDASVMIEPHEEWPLTYIPIESTIRIWIDTQLNYDWVYDATTNSIQFTVIPPGGSHVEIAYIIDPDPGSDTGDDDDSGA